MATRLVTPFVDRAQLYATMLVDIHTSPAIRLHSGLGGLTTGGNTYLGVGDLGDVEGLTESSEVVGQEFTLGLSASDGSLLSAALSESVQGRRVELALGTSTDQANWQRTLLRSGVVGNIQITANGLALVCYTAMTDLIRPATYARRYTDDHQQAIVPGDRVFRFVSEIENVEVRF